MGTYGANRFELTAPGICKLYSKWNQAISFTIPWRWCGYQAGQAL